MVVQWRTVVLAWLEFGGSGFGRVAKVGQFTDRDNHRTVCDVQRSSLADTQYLIL